MLEISKMCKLSRKVFTKGFGHSKTATRSDMRKSVAMDLDWQRTKVIWWNKTTTNSPTISELLWCQ